MDTLKKEERRRTMQAIKGRNTKPEMIVRSYLFSKGLRFRVNVGKLPGTPDIVLKKWKCVRELLLLSPIDGSSLQH